ncbi:MAG: phosphoglycerate dehydrogenase [Deltaproteobacteria bacterium]|nr:phosphoglycerate dehydrogenase [Deltaproteobacteria bacterium]
MSDSIKRVLVSDKLSQEGLAIFEAAEGIEVDNRPGLSPEELLACIGDYHGLAIRSGTKVTAEVLAAAKKLEVVGRAGIGVDNVDREAASRRGVVVMNTPGGNTVTTAEHTLAMLMSVSRHIPQATATLKAGKWEKKKLQGRELFNKTLGVIGLGAIGRIVADRAMGLKMKVIGYDPLLDGEDARTLGVELVSLDELYRRSDYVTVHVPMTDETRGMIDAAVIEKMKPGVFIINCARGGIVDEAALDQALAAGRIGGAAFDVFVEEPPPADHPLLKHDTFVCSPHLGASTEEAQVNVAVAVAEQMVEYLTTGNPRNAVNLPAVPSDVREVIAPYLELAHRLGALAGQLAPKGAKRFTLTTAGEVAQVSSRPLASKALAAFVGARLDGNVNEVNAPHLAAEHGLELIEARAGSAGRFVSLIQIEVESEGGSFELAGTLFGEDDPRIVRMQGHDLEAIPEGALLVFHNDDQPGVVGGIGTLLGQAGINIAGMQLSLHDETGKAMSIVNVARLPDEEVLAKLAALPHILWVRTAQL